MECPVFLGAGKHNSGAISFKSPQQHCGVQDRLRVLASRPRAEPVNAKAGFWPQVCLTSSLSSLLFGYTVSHFVRPCDLIWSWKPIIIHPPLWWQSPTATGPDTYISQFLRPLWPSITSPCSALASLSGRPLPTLFLSPFQAFLALRGFA